MGKVFAHKAFGKKTGKWGVRKKKGKGFKYFTSKSSAQSYAGSGKSKSTTKKKTTSKKKGKSKPKGGTTTTNNNKLTPGKLHQYHALGSSAIRYALVGAETGDWEHAAKAGLTTYVGYDVEANRMNLGELWRGYGPTLNDQGWRKFAKAVGFRAYPQGKPNNLSTILDYATMYTSPTVRAYQNRDNPREAHRQITEVLHGVDQNQFGFASYKPASMLETRAPYLIKKIIFKLLRDNGVKV